MENAALLKVRKCVDSLDEYGAKSVWRVSCDFINGFSLDILHNYVAGSLLFKSIITKYSYYIGVMQKMHKFYFIHEVRKKLIPPMRILRGELLANKMKVDYVVQQ